MARVEVAPDLIQVFEMAADAVKLQTYEHTIDDFKNGDVVSCSLLEGIYVVDSIGIHTKRIVLRNIQDENKETINTFPVKPKYLKILDKNSKAIKVLFSKVE